MVKYGPSHRIRGLGVLIVADVRLYREGLAASLSNREHLMVVATSASRADACSRVRELSPNVVIVDISVRESLELIADLRREAPNSKVLAFAVEEVSSEILDCAEAGAAGYVTADASIENLIEAIERITSEELMCSPRVAAKLFQHISERAHRWTPTGTEKVLTIRERQVLGFIRQGRSNKEIAQQMNIAEATVKNHVHHLLEKLNVGSRAKAAARAVVGPRRRRPFDSPDIAARGLE